MFTAKEKLRITEEAENIGKPCGWKKVVFVTGKNKMQIIETNSNLWAFRRQKARHPELQRRLCNYVDGKSQLGCTVTSEMCQLKVLAVTKELGIMGFKATLRLSSSGCRPG